MFHTLVLTLENERQKNLYITERDSVISKQNNVFLLERQTVTYCMLKLIDDCWNDYRESISGFCGEIEEF